MRERQYLKLASAHPLGHLPTAASARLVEAMLEEKWVYREDGDGYALRPDEALAFQGGTAWRITARGRWSALHVRQRKLIVGLGTGKEALGPDDPKAVELARVGLAEAEGGAVGLTGLGRKLLAFGTGSGAGQP